MIPNSTKLLAALGAALSLAAAGLTADLPTWARALAALPAAALLAVYLFRAARAWKQRSPAARGPLQKLKEAERRGRRP